MTHLPEFSVGNTFATGEGSSTALRRARLWLVGHTEHLPFEQAVAALCHVQFERIASLAEAAERLATAAEPPDLVLVGVARPEEIAFEEVERLRCVTPLVRLVALLGSWCEGSRRSGKPWPAVPRVYWHSLAAQLQDDCDRIARGQTPHWSLPLTLGDDEHFLILADALNRGGEQGFKELGPKGPGATVADSQAPLLIVADSWHAYDYLAQALTWAQPLTQAQAATQPQTTTQTPWPVRWLTTAELSTVEGERLEAVAGVRSVLIDCSHGAQRAVGLVRVLRAALPQAPIWVVAGFPRHDEVVALQEAGATEVFSKPVSLAAIARA